MTLKLAIEVASVGVTAGFVGHYLREILIVRKREREGRRILAQIRARKLSHRRDMERAEQRREEHSRLLRQDLEESQPIQREAAP